MSLLNDWRSLVGELCPESCPGCEMPSGAGFCSACRQAFARIDSPCRRCGLSAWHQRCPALAADWRIDSVRAPFIYAPPLTTFLQALKYAKERHLGRALGQLLLGELGSVPSQVDALLAVPLHARRLRMRTFNQADEIARPLARAFGCRLLVAGVRRTRHTPSQTGLDRRERIASLKRAFAVRPNLQGLKLAIIDDVITTGATINALGSALKAAGADRVEAWAVARVIGPATGEGYAPRKR